MTALVKPAHPEQLSESYRQEIIQAEHPVLRALERSRDPQIQPAEDPVLPLGKTAPETCAQFVMLFCSTGKIHCHAETIYCKMLFRVPCAAQSVHKGTHHPPIRKPDRRLHIQPGRPHETAWEKGCEPPVRLRDLDTAAIFAAEHERTVQHFLVRRRRKQGRLVLPNLPKLLYIGFKLIPQIPYKIGV